MARFSEASCNLKPSANRFAHFVRDTQLMTRFRYARALPDASRMKYRQVINLDKNSSVLSGLGTAQLLPG